MSNYTRTLSIMWGQFDADASL